MLEGILMKLLRSSYDSIKYKPTLTRQNFSTCNALLNRLYLTQPLAANRGSGNVIVMLQEKIRSISCYLK